MKMDVFCPRCSEPLQRSDKYPGDSGTCLSCKGLWISKEAMGSKVLKRIQALPSQAPSIANSMEDENWAPIFCIYCASTMGLRIYTAKVRGGWRDREKGKESVEVEIDECKKHGIWFDAGELEKLVAVASGRSSQAYDTDKARETLRDRTEPPPRRRRVRKPGPTPRVRKPTSTPRTRNSSTGPQPRPSSSHHRRRRSKNGIADGIDAGVGILVLALGVLAEILD